MKNRFYRSFLATCLLLIFWTSFTSTTVAQPNSWRGNHWKGSGRPGGGKGWSHQWNARYDLGMPFIFIDASPLIPYPHWDGMIDHRYNQGDGIGHRPDQDYGIWHPGVAPEYFSPLPAVHQRPFYSHSSEPGVRRYGNHYPIDRHLPPAGFAAMVPLTNHSSMVPFGSAEHSVVPPRQLPFPIIATKAVAFSAQQRAESAFRQGLYSDAARLSEQVVILDPENGLAQLFAAQTHFSIGDYEKAIAHIKKAIKQLPVEDWDYVVREFRAFYGQNDYVDQMEQLNQYLLEFPNHRTARLLRGYHYASLGYWQAADDELNYAIAVRADEQLGNDLLRWNRGQKRPSDVPHVEPPQPVWSASDRESRGVLMIESIPAPQSIEELPSPLQNEMPDLLLPPQTEKNSPDKN